MTNSRQSQDPEGRWSCTAAQLQAMLIQDVTCTHHVLGQPDRHPRCTTWVQHNTACCVFGPACMLTTCQCMHQAQLAYVTSTPGAAYVACMAGWNAACAEQGDPVQEHPSCHTVNNSSGQTLYRTFDAAVCITPMPGNLSARHQQAAPKATPPTTAQQDSCTAKQLHGNFMPCTARQMLPHNL